MANTTILGETLDDAIVDTDFLMYWKAASGVQRRVSRAALVGATFTGGGTIATGGYTLAVTGTSSINGTLSGPGYTLTVPATGTAALLATAQTFSALKTFSAGISLGNETLSYYDEGTWTPVVADATTGGNVGTVTTAEGKYTRVGNLVTVSCWLAGITTTGMTGASAFYVRGLPFAATGTGSTYRAVAAAYVDNIAFGGYLTAWMGGTQTWVRLSEHVSGAQSAQITVSDLTSGTASVMFTLTYHV